MDASDLIKTLQNTLRGGGRPHMDPGQELVRSSCRDLAAQRRVDLARRGCGTEMRPPVTSSRFSAQIAAAPHGRTSN